MKNIMILHKKIVVLLIVAGAFMLPIGCRKELLDQAPVNNLSDKTIFATPDRFLSLINGIYDQVKSGQHYGGRFIVYGDIRAEEFLNETGNGVTGLQTWNHTVIESSNEVNNLWNACYTAINSCNIFIEGADINRAVVNNDALVNQYIAEAKFVRALCYHTLLRMYAQPYAVNNGGSLGVPLRIRAEVGPGNNDLARSSVAEVTAQILDDLNSAEANLAATNGSGLLNVTRAHKNAAIALKVRVYMGMQQYGNAISEANKIVPTAAPFKAASGVAHELQANVKNVFTTPYTTTESIFSMPFTTNDLPGVQNGLGSYYNPGPRGIGDFSLNPAGIIGDSVAFPGNDARRQFVLMHTNNKPYLNKFPTGPEHLDYAPVLRYAEVLLSLAEAEARANGVSQRAVDLLNAIRIRSNAAATPYTTADFADGNALANIILKERRVELLGEGFRAFDLQRLVADIPGKANVASVLTSVSEYIWPIPSGEIAVNKACVQNP